MSNTMSNQIKVKKADIRAILEATFPEYRGRKFSVRLSVEYQMADYWDGGSRREVKAVTHIPSGYAKPYEPWSSTVGWVSTNHRIKAGIPWDITANAKIHILWDVLLVEHEIFMGGDMGITIWVHPCSAYLSKMFPGRQIKDGMIDCDAPVERVVWK